MKMNRLQRKFSPVNSQLESPMSQSTSSRSSNASLPALKKNQAPPHYSSNNGHNHHQSQQLVHPSTQGKFIMDDVISSQGSMKRDVMRNSESVQAVRQESIMLAEKVQHATNLYRQLAARVGKTEERYEMEQKSMGSILGKAKQIEMQLIQQQEQLVSKEGQLALQVHKLQEEVVLLKNEREGYRRQMQSVQQEVRTIADKITHQSGALANGLQDLKSYLDTKEMDKKQEFSTTFSAMQGKIDSIEHRVTISQAKTEGRCEKLHLQIVQNDKQRQEDVYQIATSIREKEAISKADVRRLDERVKNMFEDVMKGSRTSEGKMKTDFDVKFIEIERKVAFEQKDVTRRMSELDEEISTKMGDLIESNREEMNTFATDIQEQLDASQGIDEMKRDVKQIDKTLQNHKKDIEKVLRAEISSRVSQGEKLNLVLGELKKDNVESLAFLEATFGDHKRKHDESMELVKKDLVRYVSESMKANKCAFDESRYMDAEKKLDEMEDALEELAKQEERIGMNSEQLKQIEMENILAQGDMNISIDTNTKEISIAKEDIDGARKKVKVVEKKLMFLAEAFESYKSENRYTPSKVPSQRDTPAAPSADIEKAKEKINKALTLIKDILQLNLIDGDPDQERHKNKKMLYKLQRELEDISDNNASGDSEDEDGNNNNDADGVKEEDDDKEMDRKDNSDEDNSDKEDEESDKEDEEEDKNKKKKKDPPLKYKEKDKKKKTDSEDEEAKSDKEKEDVGKKGDDDESEEEPEDDDEEWSDDDDDDDDSAKDSDENDDESDENNDNDDKPKNGKKGKKKPTPRDNKKDKNPNGKKGKPDRDKNDEDDDDQEPEKTDDEPDSENDDESDENNDNDDKPKNNKKDKKKPTSKDNKKDKNPKNKKEKPDRDKDDEDDDDQEPEKTDDEPDSENDEDPKSDNNDEDNTEAESDRDNENDKKQKNKDKPKKNNQSDSDTGSRIGGKNKRKETK